jgi:hypothetical protein
MRAILCVLLCLWSQMWALPAWAAPFDLRFCAVVETDFIDNAAGDVWTTPGLYTPGRGFWIKVENNDLSTTVWEDWADVTGTYAGCTDEMEIDDAYDYDVKVISKAKVDNVTIMSYDDQTTPHLVTNLALNNFTPTTDQRYDLSPVPGDTESQWNFLALVAMALTTEDAAIGTVTLEVYKDGSSPAYSYSAHKIVAPDGWDRKFMLTHEVGHFVSLEVSGGAAADGSAPLNNCDGNAGIVHKEYQSYAGKEAIASYYAAYVLNDHSALDDCEFQPNFGIDWDLNGAIDTNNMSSYVCIGDPYSGSPDPGADDWLEDLITLDDDNTDGFQCQGQITNRSSEYDWMRYLWDMTTIQAVPISGIWSIWAGADPASWNTDDSGMVADFPKNRMEDSAVYEGYGTEHTNAMIHGLDH